MALTLESSRHIPCAVSLRFADGTWNVPATLRVKSVPLVLVPPPTRQFGTPHATDLANTPASFFPKPNRTLGNPRSKY